jgi:DNA processing protein
MPPPVPEWTQPELLAWLRLLSTPGIGNASARRLLTRLGTPQQVFAATVADWRTCVSAAQAEQLATPVPDLEHRAQQTWQWLHDSPAAGVQQALIALGDPRYPPALLQIADPPLLLYAQGPAAWLQRPAPLVEMVHCLAVVGSRNPTAQGAENAHQFARALAAMGWTVVSGLAAGIDAAAHEGALATAPLHTLATVAVVGTGLDRVYPARHQDLARRIAQHGLVLSEFPLGTPPLANNFPKRNRIISGLCSGTLVVEAALASGSLITARTASEQGREVFAIPGSIHAPQARGCHALIRQGAKLVETAQDIIEELQAPTAPALRRAPADQGATSLPLDFSGPAAAPGSVPPQHPVLEAMGYDPVGLDALGARTGLDAAHLQAQLLELELDGWVVSLPGGFFQRMAKA